MLKSTHSMLAMANLSAGAAIAEVQTSANNLANVMQRIHGGEWRVQIEHEDGLIVIARRLGARRATPKLEDL